MIPKPKRGRGRPKGVKDRKPRKRLPRPIIAPEIENLSPREAAAVAGVGPSIIKRHLRELGAVRVGNRIVVFRDRLNTWLRSQPAISNREHRAMP